MLLQPVISNILAPEISDGKAYLIDVDKNRCQGENNYREKWRAIIYNNPLWTRLCKISNLTVDGYSFVERVTELPNNEKEFLIINWGGGFGAFFINAVLLVNGGYIFTKASEESGNKIDGIHYSVK